MQLPLLLLLLLPLLHLLFDVAHLAREVAADQQLAVRSA
jgi:hypothetical protein